MRFCDTWRSTAPACADVIFAAGSCSAMCDLLHNASSRGGSDECEKEGTGSNSVIGTCATVLAAMSKCGGSLSICAHPHALSDLLSRPRLGHFLSRPRLGRLCRMCCPLRDMKRDWGAAARSEIFDDLSTYVYCGAVACRPEVEAYRLLHVFRHACARARFSSESRQWEGGGANPQTSRRLLLVYVCAIDSLHARDYIAHAQG
jgi:hypothetical protein